MAFTYSSGIITHSGTDTSYSGLTGLTGVTVTVAGNTTIYDLNASVRLVFSSTSIFTHNPDKEVIILRFQIIQGTAALTVNSSAIYNYGIKTVVNGIDRYSDGNGIVACTDSETSNLQVSSISILSGGTFNWNGGNILSQGTFILNDGCFLNQNSGSFIVNSDYLGYQFRVMSSSSISNYKININNLTLDAFRSFPARMFTTNGFNVGVFNLKNAFFQTYIFYQPPLLLTNLNNKDNIASTDITGASNTPANASTVTIRNASKVVRADANSVSSLYLKVERSISLSFINTDNTDAGKVSIYGVDLNNGSRITGPQGQDDIANKIYSASQNSPITFNMLRNIVNYVQGRSPQRYDDSRTNAAGNIPLNAFSYKSIFVTVNPALIGLDTFSQTYYLPSDSLVTEINKAIVDLYVNISNAYEFYDYAKSYLFDNYSGETLTIVRREANKIIASPYDVVFDADAVDVFAFDGITITVKSSEYISDITTSGLVTTLNGAIITGNISDENGDSNITVTTPAGYEDDVAVYSTLTDAENETNQIGSGLKFRYLNSVYGGTNIWYRMTAIDGSYIIENYLVPALTGNYEVSLVVTSENAALGAIKAVTDKLDAMIEVISGEQVFKTTALQNVTPTDLTGVAKQSTVLGLY